MIIVTIVDVGTSKKITFVSKIRSYKCVLRRDISNCKLQFQQKQNKTKQNKTKQNKTKQNKTKQNKTKQNIEILNTDNMEEFWT